VGTLGYIAPELFDGHSADDRSDIFSLGVILWQLLTGNSMLPIELSEISQNDIAHTWIHKYRQHYIDYVKSLREGIIPDNPLSQVVEKCLCADPYDRFGNFPELQEALEILYTQETGSSFQVIESPQRSAIEHRRRGICLEFAGKYQEALDQYNQAIALEPACVSAWTNKAYVCAFGREKTTKIDCLDKALSIDPHFVRALNNKGLELSDQKKYEQAAVCYDRAIEYAPGYVSPLANKGMMLHQQKKYAEAHDCFNQAIALNPRDTRAVLWQSSLHAEEQHWQKALNNIDHVLAIDPLNITAWNRKLYYLNELKNEEVESFCLCRWSGNNASCRPEDTPYYQRMGIGDKRTGIGCNRTLIEQF
jgi:tetratricopeptide (TPR) repeat protein